VKRRSTENVARAAKADATDWERDAAGWPGTAPKNAKEEFGKEAKIRETRPISFAEVHFPLIAARPAVMDAAQRAMALGLFDQMGICAERKGDPLIIGQTLLPPVNGRTPRKMASFLIAWHLNLNDL
jgi:hypothetical protein